MVTFDFDPSGKSVGMIDRFGVCSISDLDTDRRDFFMKFEMENERGTLLDSFSAQIAI